ncbi:hypothetical protein GCK32_016829 [Trichostrongylus colubriformis]|uniref:Uncharacterized protein n=1 Tax=Trichostrongylus colubriformis TaxID=6319 RepID=A0AAN8FRN2_TRICO
MADSTKMDTSSYNVPSSETMLDGEQQILLELLEEGSTPYAKCNTRKTTNGARRAKKALRAPLALFYMGISRAIPATSITGLDMVRQKKINTQYNSGFNRNMGIR